MNDLQEHRIFYARLVTAIGGVDSSNKKLLTAFSTVPREDYLGPGPWKVGAGLGSIDTPSNNPIHLYQDVLVALNSDKKINNGQPSLHARCINSLRIVPGENIVHIGAGTGYYTAILAELVGKSGSITAFEIDAELAFRATQNLNHYSNVTVKSCSGTEGAMPKCDVIYVNAGITDPVDEWFDVLSIKGRVLFPLTAEQGHGGMLLLERADKNKFKARFISSAGFIPCSGARTKETENKLSNAFKNGGAQNVRSFHLGTSTDKSCWLAAKNWWLSTDDVQ